MKKNIIVLLVVVVVGAAIGGYFLFFAQKQSGTSPFSPSEKIKDALGIQPSTKNWQTYKNNKHGFSIKYPSNYEVKEEGGGIIFVPPELKDRSAQPTTLKELPLAVLFSPDKSYDDIKKEIKTQIEGVGYREEKEKMIAGVLGTELKQGPSPESEHKLHQLFNIIPHKNTALIFLTYALSKEQLESKGAPLLDAFISTFKPE